MNNPWIALLVTMLSVCVGAGVAIMAMFAVRRKP